MKLESSWRKALLVLIQKLNIKSNTVFALLNISYSCIHVMVPMASWRKLCRKRKVTLSLSMTDRYVILHFKLAVMSSELMESNKTCRAGEDVWSKTFWEEHSIQFSSVQSSSVAQSCPAPCDPMNYSTPGLPVHHQLPEFTQTHVH